MIPNYVPLAKPTLSRAYHGSYPQAARIASSEGLRSGSHDWWNRIREIRDHWHNTGQLNIL